MDLALLSTLPDSVKRDILLAVHNQATPAQPPTASGSSTRTLAPVLSAKLQGGCCILEGFCDSSEVKAVRGEAETILKDAGRQARMGGGPTLNTWESSKIRGDLIMWVHESGLLQQGHVHLPSLLQRMASMRTALAQQGYDVGGRITFQLGCYPGGGARYLRHSDASASAPGRCITAICYLNPAWSPQRDGGHLAIYSVAHSTVPGGTAAGWEAGEPAILVAPLGGRLVVFESQLEHEVLPCQGIRYAVTAWFYRTASRPDTEPGQAAAATQHPTPQPAASRPALIPADDSPAGNRQHGDGSTAAEPNDAATDAETHVAGSASEGNSCGTAAAVASGPSPQETGPTACSSVSGSPSMQCETPGTQAAEAACSGSASVPRGVAEGDCIFVSIAAYRDEDCRWTVKELFVKARQPLRLRIAVVWQVDYEQDAAFMTMSGLRPEWRKQIREVRVPSCEAEGPSKARALAHALYAGERYFMQIDSHMRFVEGWDDLCILELAAAEELSGSARVVLSTYPTGFEGSGASARIPDNSPPTLLCAKGFDNEGLLRVHGRTLRRRPQHPVPSLFWAAGFHFSAGSFVQDVPYSPHLPYLFFGEELYMLARMWTRGWDLFAPTRPISFHQWSRSARCSTPQQDGHWDLQQRALSQQKVMSLLRGGTEAPQWLPGTAWGLGTARDLLQFQEHIGVDFVAQVVTDHACLGGLKPDDFEE